MANPVVRARIDKHIKEEATAVLNAMGLTVSDAFRLMMIRGAKEKALPFEPLIPNKKTINANMISRPADTALYADAAQVNTFQAPASASNPMFEEWYYLDLQTNYANPNNQPNGHFRHSQKAEVTFADGHVDLEKPVSGSIDKRLPSQFIGQLRPEILVPQ